MSTLTWKGDEIRRKVIERASNILSDIGGAAEGYAKGQLSKGHGVLTGTLRRSIHTATPGFNWAGDSGGGGKGVPVEKGGRLTLELGSGLTYALAIHQGWSGAPFQGSFAGYHYLTNGVEQARKDVPAIVERHKL